MQYGQDYMQITHRGSLRHSTDCVVGLPCRLAEPRSGAPHRARAAVAMPGTIEQSVSQQGRIARHMADIKQQKR